MSPWSTTIFSAAVVDVTPNLLRIFCRCIEIVLKLRCNFVEISRCVNPCHSRCNTSNSRGERGLPFIMDDAFRTSAMYYTS
jgi:hypothetical protein